MNRRTPRFVYPNRGHTASGGVRIPKGYSRAHLRNRIAYWREIRGLTQRDLAAILHVHPVTLVRWELGVHQPPPEMLPIIARALKRPERDVFLDG